MKTKLILAIFIFLVARHPLGASTGVAVVNLPVSSGDDLCESAKEFKAVHSFLLTEKDFPLPEKLRLDISMRAAKGCTGAARRFASIYNIFKKSGVDLKLSIEAALKFSALTDVQASNFTEIFPQIYLKEFFDLDFMNALEMSMKLAEVATGSAEFVKEDFSRISKFCLNEKSIGLPLKQCAELAFFVGSQTKYFDNGAAAPFLEMYDYLRKDTRIGLSVSDALKVLYQIFRYGPLAPGNFKEGLEYALAANGPRGKVADALKVGLALAKLSTKTLPPPTVEEVNLKK